MEVYQENELVVNQLICVGNVYIEFDVDVWILDNGEEREGFIEEKFNFFDSDSFLDFQLNFDLSFFEVMED